MSIYYSKGVIGARKGHNMEEKKKISKKVAKKKAKGGRPKRFKGGFKTISIQLPLKLLKKYEEEARGQRLSKSRFGQFLLEFWLVRSKEG